MANYGFYVNTDLCIKCWTCEIACKQWHEIPAGTYGMRRVHEKTEGTFPNVKRTFYSLSCLQCSNPACVEKCPTSAIEKNADTGIITVIEDKCTGCGVCVEACPFGIPEIEGKMAYICDCCSSIGIKPGDSPYCVQSCPMQALRFGEKDLDKEVLDGDPIAALSVPLAKENPDSEELVVAATVIKSADEMPEPPSSSSAASSGSSGSASASSASASASSASASAASASASSASASASSASTAATPAAASDSGSSAAAPGDNCPT